ncbi:MAG: AIR synthase-related protein, partial [Desulfovibrionaceae bacterium]
AGSFANKSFCQNAVAVQEGLDPLLVDLVFDAQTSGGLLLAVAEDKLDGVLARLAESGDLAAVIGRVAPAEESRPALSIVGG